MTDFHKSNNEMALSFFVCSR